jgi:hypothetical protein
MFAGLEREMGEKKQTRFRRTEGERWQRDIKASLDHGKSTRKPVAVRG